MKDEMIKELGKSTMDKLDEELDVNSSLQNVSHCEPEDEDTTVYLFEELEESKIYSIFKGVVLCFIASYVGYIIFDSIKNSCG